MPIAPWKNRDQRCMAGGRRIAAADHRRARSDGASDFELFGLNATTAPVVPLTPVNGPIRNKLNIPYKHGCLGGAPSTSTAVGALFA
jgi:hypothetical protein